MNTYEKVNFEKQAHCINLNRNFKIDILRYITKNVENHED